MPAGTGGLAPLAPEAGGPGPCSRVRGPGLSPGSFNRPRHIQPGCPRTCHLGWGLHCPWPHSLSSPPFRQACRRIPAQAVVHGGVSLPAAVCGGLTGGGGGVTLLIRAWQVRCQRGAQEPTHLKVLAFVQETPRARPEAAGPAPDAWTQAAAGPPSALTARCVPEPGLPLVFPCRTQWARSPGEAAVPVHVGRAGRTLPFG